ncbi:MAG: protein kinase [Byssovorax sp.]
MKVGEILAEKYQIERVLGVGGMGVVVAAKHLLLGERVAIKFLLPQALERQDVVARFRQEARAAAKLKSEHVARVHDVGTLESGAPFMVMEYLEGSDIGAVIRDRGSLPIEVAVSYVLQACEALAEAHAAGIVHRDLKPGNLFLIKKNDGSPSIKIIDFGISKVGPSAEGPVDGTGEMTQTAVMMGSPLYMAPEQMASARDVDARADIWSLGVLLHCLLTGSPPFKAASVMGVYELIMAGAPRLRSLRADAPEGLEAALLRCLQKNRNERFATVAELADALAPFGPPDAEQSAARTSRIHAAKARMDSGPPPALTSSGAAIAVSTPAASRRESAPRSLSAKPAQLSGKPAGAEGPDEASLSRSAAGDPSATDGPWGQNTSPPTRRGKRIPLIVAGMLGTIAVGVGVILGLRARDREGISTGPSATPAASSAATPTAPVVSPADSLPDPVASASAPADPGTAPTTTSPSSPSSPTSTSVTGGPKPSGAPLGAATGYARPGPTAPAPTTKTAPKPDLWGNRN